jgi:hypothetical protein
MRNRLLAVAAMAAMAAFSAGTEAASVTLSGLLDQNDGRSYDLDGHLPLSDNWSVGAGVGRSESSVTDADFSGTSLRLSTDLAVGGFAAGVSMQRWNDSGQLRSTGVLGQLGWTADNGLSLSGLLDDRSLTLKYSATIAGQLRERQVDFNGTGVGADVSWFGEQWNLGVRYIDYQYGNSMDRVQAVLNAPDTGRFPRLQLLLDSVATRAVGAPDRQFSATFGRQFARASVQGDWSMQRDALSGTQVNSFSLTHGYEFSAQLQIDTTLGFSTGGADGTVAFAGLALTLGK